MAGQARDAVTPPVSCTFHTVDYQGAPLLIAEVQGLPLKDRPARHRGQAYLRQADGDYPMSDQEISQIEMQKTQAFARTHPDRQGIDGSSMDDLDPSLLSAFLSAVRAGSRRHARLTDDREVLRRCGVLADDGTVSLADCMRSATTLSSSGPA